MAQLTTQSYIISITSERNAVPFISIPQFSITISRPPSSFTDLLMLNISGK